MAWLKKNYVIMLIVVLIAIKQIIFILAVPPWQNHDEPAHFSYTQYLVEEHRLPVYGGGFPGPKVLSYSEEYARSEIVTGATRAMRGSNDQYRFIHQFFNPTLANDASQLGGDRHPLVDTMAPEQYRHLYYRLPTDGTYKNSAAIYQPLYYVYEALPYLAFKSSDILTRLYAMRLWSMLCYLAAIVVCYRCFRLVYRNQRFCLTATLIVGFQPVLSHLAAGLNNDVLLFLFTSLSIFWCLRLIRQLCWRHAAWLGVALGLGLLTKPQFIFLPITALLPFAFHWLRNRDLRRLTIYSLTLCVVIALAISGWWFAWSYSHYGHFFMDTKTLVAHSTSPISWHYAATQYIYRWLYALASYNFAFGFASEMQLPMALSGFIIGVTILALLGLVKLAVTQWKKTTSELRAAALLGFFAVALLEMTYLYLFSKALFTTGSARFPIDGRYYLPLVVVIAGFGLLGLGGLIPARWHRLLYGSVATIVLAINAVALGNVLLPYFYL